MKKLEEIYWWHRIKLPDGTITPGECKHGEENEDFFSERFGMPLDLSGKTVLDIGCWDGLFSFEAERRGATVVAIDPYQNRKKGSNDGFQYAKKALNSKVEFHEVDLEGHWAGQRDIRQYDITLYYGVLYHVVSPLRELKYLRHLTKEFALIETAISEKEGCVYEFLPGHADDHTNLFYPTIEALEKSLLHVGFSRVEVIYKETTRATVKAIV